MNSQNTADRGQVREEHGKTIREHNQTLGAITVQSRQPSAGAGTFAKMALL